MTDDLPLAAEFPPATRDDWLKLVRAALKDQPFDRLIARTYDGIPIQPVYARAADAAPLAARLGPWKILSRIEHPDPAAANAEALHELQNGATGLTLVFAGSLGAYGYGLPSDAAAVARLLEGVALDAITIEIETAEPSKQAADHVAALALARNYAPDKLDVHFGHDAIGAHSLTGTLPIPFAELMPRFAAHVAALATAGFKGPLAVADGRLVHNAGGAEAQELAYVLGVALAYLRALEGAGISLDRARQSIGFRLSADADQFLTTVKFRALRKLWARVEDACGLPPRPAYIVAETAWRMMTKRDPYVNVLRATIASFSAAVGGADAITVLPFTTALGLPDRFARRIARNLQLLLLEESNLAKVADPAAGSGAVEALTDDLCRAAWTLFQEFEAAGGIAAALERGVIQQKIGDVRAARELAVARRNAPLTGTSEFADLGEQPVAVLPARPLAVPESAGAIRYPALAPIRLATPFERLRDASDRMLAETGARPKIFLANLGRPADFNARASYAKNLFEAGGIEAVTNDGFASQRDMIAAFASSGAKLACLCSSDEIYGREGAAAAKALQSAGALHIYVSGRPAQTQSLQAAGAATFLEIGGNALETLRAAHDILGIKA